MLVESFLTFNLHYLFLFACAVPTAKKFPQPGYPAVFAEEAFA
jgi:hypothetical protein